MASEVQTPVDGDDTEPEQPAVAPDAPVEERKLGIARANQNPADQRERPELVHELGHEILVQRMMPEEALASLERKVERDEQAKSAEDHPGQIKMKCLRCARRRIV